ncbi:Rhodanese-like domain-containing protein 15, chloroplastic [Heracleum sosnowskyi]|uniref:Rhodanese-like domain-containing protein 15, chloroplastic n=1 Tax=Heracleum sosnowskyi TaxID=360622 RepID=A0AAD8IP64_9APIA|nr:Rhodanese-like domain-containing protein 15, chloroplastic [Heracleum sosnowskyi]
MWSSTSVIVPCEMICNNAIAQQMLLSTTTNSRFPLPRRRSHTLTYNNYGHNSNLSWMATMENNNHVVSTSTTTSVNHPTSVPVRVAHELYQAGHRYLDVRTPGEYSAGHAAAAINIPYMFQVGSGMTKNPNFVDQVLTHFRKDDEIVVGCQSGKRSFMAATDLLSAGFTGVTDIAGGFAAWSQNELPVDA